MPAALEKLGTIISDLEAQTHEIAEYGNVLRRISDAELEIEKTSELTKQSTENLSRALTKYTDFIDTIDTKIESQNLTLNDFKSDINKQNSKFSNELIEKLNVLRGESLNAHIDIRQDIERVGKSNARVNALIKEVKGELSAYSNKNSKDLEERHNILESLLLEHKKNISLNNKVVLFIASFTVILLPLSIYFSLK